MQRGIPNYELYGELLAGQAPDPIHLEPIRERSSKHDWTINVHAHRRLAQIFLFRTSGVYFNVGEVRHVTSEPALLVVYPGIPHGFRFTEDVVGDVLSIQTDRMPNVLLDRLARFANPTGAFFSGPETQCFEDIVILFDQLRKIYHRWENQRAAIIATLVDLITLYLAGQQSDSVSLTLAKPGDIIVGQDSRAQTFCELLEENFRDHWTVSDYACRMGLSASHLTRICRELLHAPPNALVRQRRILEAKRLLEYTSLPLSEIAHRSGFRDTAFFSRTFKSFVGVAPNAYRSSLDR